MGMDDASAQVIVSEMNIKAKLPGMRDIGMDDRCATGVFVTNTNKVLALDSCAFGYFLNSYKTVTLDRLIFQYRRPANTSVRVAICGLVKSTSTCQDSGTTTIKLNAAESGTDEFFRDDIIEILTEPPFTTVTLTASGNWTVPEGVTSVDVFVVGAGGGGGLGGNGGGGGGGGYTKTFKKDATGWRDGPGISVAPGQVIPVVIGVGAQTAAGGYSEFMNSSYRAPGGLSGAHNVNNGPTEGGGGSGGSGGGACAVNGGADGANGTTSGSRTGGVGQAHTTRAFGEAAGTLYSGGGAGNGASPGAGGGGGDGANGVANTGGGGGGGFKSGSGFLPGSSGGSGCILIRYTLSPKAQIRKIISYNGSVKQATVDVPWGVKPAPGTSYTIRKGIADGILSGYTVPQEVRDTYESINIIVALEKGPTATDNPSITVPIITLTERDWVSQPPLTNCIGVAWTSILNSSGYTKLDKVAVKSSGGSPGVRITVDGVLITIPAGLNYTSTSYTEFPLNWVAKNSLVVEGFSSSQTCEFVVSYSK